ncbi:hypothetical protein DFH09DRAFT_1108250 [Mycena vulgaris]|nr:hypothetical protein DFH09DRAFT_1108250 [Mycena vulgaris]
MSAYLLFAPSAGWWAADRRRNQAVRRPASRGRTDQSHQPDGEQEGKKKRKVGPKPKLKRKELPLSWIWVAQTKTVVGEKQALNEGKTLTNRDAGETFTFRGKELTNRVKGMTFITPDAENKGAVSNGVA